MNIPNIIQHIADECHQSGGTAWIVGGSIRDMFLGIKPKDWDLEVHNLTGEVLFPILKKIGKSKRVGKSFSVFKLYVQREEIDISLPQNDKRDDPNMGIEEALRRRDLSINAMAYNLHTHSLFDPFGGQQDIQDRILRATDPNTFIQDPLRAFRVAQFSSRLSFEIAPELILLCQKLSFDQVPKERIQTELNKIWLCSPTPSIGLMAMEKLLLFSALPLWKKPTHTDVLTSVDRCAQHKVPNEKEAYTLIRFWISALQKNPIEDIEPFLHDLKIFSINKINLPKKIIPFLKEYKNLLANPSDPIIRRFSEHTLLSIAVSILPIFLKEEEHKQIQHIESRAKLLKVWNKKLPILVQGKQLMTLGFVGKEIGNALEQIREQQLCGMVNNSKEALQFLNKSPHK